MWSAGFSGTIIGLIVWGALMGHEVLAGDDYPLRLHKASRTRRGTRRLSRNRCGFKAPRACDRLPTRSPHKLAARQSTGTSQGHWSAKRIPWTNVLKATIQRIMSQGLTVQNLHRNPFGELPIDNNNLGVPAPDYVDENVSDRVVRIVQSYVAVVNKMGWRKG